MEVWSVTGRDGKNELNTGMIANFKLEMCCLRMTATTGAHGGTRKLMDRMVGGCFCVFPHGLLHSALMVRVAFRLVRSLTDMIGLLNC